MMQLISNTAAEVKVHDFPQNTALVSYKFVGPEIQWYFWIKNFECPYNIYNSNNLDSYESFMYPSYYISIETLNTFLNNNPKQYKKLKFSCVGVIPMSTIPKSNFSCGNVNFYGVDFKLSDDKKTILSSNRYRLPNTCGGVICWGNREGDTGNDNEFRYEGSISDKVNTFLYTPFNNDYVPLKDFYSSIQSAKYSSKNKHNNFGTTLFCVNYDAMLTISMEKHPVAFLRLKAAGLHKPLREYRQDIMVVPLIKGVWHNDGEEYHGYYTPEDAIGKKWFIEQHGYLLGQVDSE